ncbi:hypothetical protein MYCTH_2129459 [Thermothelomyces thermophilus ATCC 42464]|uniref:Uncharacterized protein n=1 Tax=Thermothelomyces thermophilus (strain ATCC 42464 / BCRC 31852 / DSM 1799) TaxID=573729 RepID=G2QIP3_THET4|nr:uncharacterized protein MYCTH_2129459 [Thermothelomyces thermophilus ATCC 42464]AEO60365.1 hypothetical protein MYCTH_2129459 [Thermothelomyces thermophilus ATCC 42464]
MSLNTNQLDPRQRPPKAVATAIGAGVEGEHRGPRVSHRQSAKGGPANIIAKVSGCVLGGKREDDGLYFTNNNSLMQFQKPSNIVPVPFIFDEM